MIPLLTTCCCGIVSVRSASLLVASLLIFGPSVHLLFNILDISGAIKPVYGSRGCIDIIIINILCIVVHILLIVGIEKRKLSLIKPAAVFNLVVAAFFFGVTCTLYMSVESSAVMLLVFLVMGLAVALFSYFWLIVHSCYRQLKNELHVSSDSHEETNPLAVATHPWDK